MHFGFEYGLARELAAREYAAAVNEPKAGCFDPGVAAARLLEPHASEHIGEAASVGAGVVDHGAAQRPRDANRPPQAIEPHAAHLPGEAGEAHAAFDAVREAGRIGVLGSRTVVHGNAPDPGIGHQDIASRTEYEEGHIRLAGGVRRRCQCHGVAHRQENVRGATHAEGGVACQRFIPPQFAVRFQRCGQNFKGAHRSSSKIFGPTSTTSPAPMVKMTSPERANPAAAAAASSKVAA